MSFGKGFCVSVKRWFWDGSVVGTCRGEGDIVNVGGSCGFRIGFCLLGNSVNRRPTLTLFRLFATRS